MGKIIRITEAQAKEIAKRINEEQGVGTQINVQDTTGDNRPDVKGTYNKTVRDLGQQVADNATYTINGSQAAKMMEGKCITKRQIKENKLKKLRESSTGCSKKELLKKF